MKINGFFDGIFNGYACGWAITDEDSYLEIEIIDKSGNVLAKGLANLARSDLDNQKAGFAIALPHANKAWLKDDVNARVAKSGIMLNVSAPARKHDYVLHIDGFAERNVLNGWLMDKTNPIARKLFLRRDGEIISEAVNYLPIDAETMSGRFNFNLPEHYFTPGCCKLQIYDVLMDSVVGEIDVFLPGEEELPLWRWPFLALSQDAVEAEDIESSALLENGAVLAANSQEASAEALIELGRQSLAQGWHDDAVRYYVKAWERAPMHPEVNAGIARALAYGGEVEKARKFVASISEKQKLSGAMRSVLLEMDSLTRNKSIRTIAFYLPQFHAIPENDQWWGKGFTEWTNVASARPLFQGHIQPRLPAELGFYDLSKPDAANAQFKLAREYGIDGFCYYYYWFNGKRLLEKPLDDLVSGRVGPFPFCICWVNENWSRNWDGGADDILIEQIHDFASDSDFIKDAAPLLAHKDYIRFEGKPILLIYRAFTMDDPCAVTAHWRKYCLDIGLGEIFLACVQTKGMFIRPDEYGFDAAVQFPPQWNANKGETRRFFSRAAIDRKDVAAFDYGAFASSFLSLPERSYRFFPGSTLAWDNTARMKSRASILHNYKEPLHRQWYWDNIGRSMRAHGDGLVFINAWNEWAEGSTLEPDAHWGHANLVGVKKAGDVAELAPYKTWWQNGMPVLRAEGLVAGEHIALACMADTEERRAFLLNWARAIKLSLGHDLTIIAVSAPGYFIESCERLGCAICIDQESESRELDARLAAGEAWSKGCDKAIILDASLEWLLKPLHERGIIAAVMHEMGGSEGEGSDLARFAVFPSFGAALAWVRRCWPDFSAARVVAPGAMMNPRMRQREGHRAKLRLELGLDADAALVYASGPEALENVIAAMADFMPGRKVLALLADGAEAGNLPECYGERLVIHLDKGRWGEGEAASDLYLASDGADLRSILGAAVSGLPVLIWNGRDFGDIFDDDDHVRNVKGSALDAAKAAAQMLKEDVESARAERFEKAGMKFGMAAWAGRVLSLFGGCRRLCHARELLSVSVVVANRNCAQHLELRLRSIFAQSVKPLEILVVDYGSGDASMEILERVAKNSRVAISVVGGPSQDKEQFDKAMSNLRGDIIWNTDARDYSEPMFLETLLPCFEDDTVVMAYSNSCPVDYVGGRVAFGNVPWLDRGRPEKSHVLIVENGVNAVESDWLAGRRLPGHSSALLRRGHKILQGWQNGIWDDLPALFGIALCGKVIYCPEILNYERLRPLPRAISGRQSLLDWLLAFLCDFAGRLALHGEKSHALFRGLEGLYAALFSANRLGSLKHDPRFKKRYEILEDTLLPLSPYSANTDFCRRAGRAALVISGVANVWLASYLARNHELAIVILEGAQEGSESFADIGCAAFKAESDEAKAILADAEIVYALDVDVAIYLSEAGANLAKVVVICEKGYEELGAREDVESLLPRLIEVFAGAKKIVSLEMEAPQPACSIATCAGRKIYHWQLHAFCKLMNFLEALPKEVDGVYAYGESAPLIAARHRHCKAAR